MLKQKSVFDGFTEKYQLSKTLRFELKPTEKTKEMLKCQHVVETDEQIDKYYHQIVKPLLDELHRKFVAEALGNYQLPQELVEEFFKAYKKLKEDKKLNEQNIKKISEPLRKILVEQFVNTAKAWKKRHSDIKFKSEDWHILTEKAVIALIKKEHPEKEKELKSFDKFFTYLYRFNQTRENLYTSDGEATAIATRIIDENLSFFVSNVLLFEGTYKSILSEIPKLESRSEIFELPYFSKCLLQTGIEQYRLKIGDINKAVNLWRQQKAAEDRKFKKKEYKLFTSLYRQILAEYTTEETQWDVREDGQMVTRVWGLIKVTNVGSKRAEDFFGDFVKNFENGAWDVERIYIPKRALNTVTGKWFESRETIENAIADVCGIKKVRRKKNSDEEEFTIKLPDFVSLEQITKAIEGLEEGGAIIWRQNLTREQKENKAVPYANFVNDKKGLNAFLAIFKREFVGSLEKFDEAVKEIQSKLPESAEYNKGKAEQKEAIVELIRAALSAYQLFKYFYPYKGKNGEGQGADNPDEEFYGVYNDIRVNDDFDSIVPRFLALRSHLARKDYLQRKPWSRRDVELKWKLNFDKPNLLTGWAETGEEQKAQYRGYILRKKDDEHYEYYLAISDYDHYLSRIKYPEIESKDGGLCYEKLEYRQLNWGKNIAGGKVYSSYTKNKIGKELKYKDHEKEISEKEHAKFLLQLINDKYRRRYPELEILFGAKQYNSPKELRLEFNKIKIGGIDFVPIRAPRINEQEIKIGKKIHRLFLFKLTTNSLRSRKRSVHSAYWGALLDGKANISKESGKLLIDLGGNAEIFFRPATPNLKQEKIKTQSGKIIGENYTKKKKKYIHKERYTEDKYFFHCPIVLNAQAPTIPNKKAPKLGFIRRFNEMTIEDLRTKSDKLAVLGLDRGEKNLIYYSLIKQDGTIIKTGSFNEIEHNGNKVDYFAKLVVREAERDLARKDVRKIEGIKELKQGYLSHVVHKVAKLVLEHKAIVVLENLDKGFKRGRFKIERQTYQKLEKALIEKFNFLVDDKNAIQGTRGSVFNGYQITAPFESFKTIGKQSGILFYTAAGYTSKTDPVTGWRPHVYIGWSDTNKKIKGAFERFNTIGWDKQRQAWIFSYNVKDFVEDGPNKEWEFVADDSLVRLRRERNQLNGYWDSKEVKPKNFFDWIFNEKQWGIKKSQDMREVIWKLDAEGKLSKKCSFPESGKEGNFWQWLAYAWTLLYQIRNSRAESYKKDESRPKSEKGEFLIPLLDESGKLVVKKKGEDYILSPVLMPDGKHFDSRKGFQGHEWNGDANGAYNIARKGVLLLKRIQRHPAEVEQFLRAYQNNPHYTFSEDKKGNFVAVDRQNKKDQYQIHKIRPDLFISNTEWDVAVQDWGKFIQN